MKNRISKCLATRVLVGLWVLSWTGMMLAEGEVPIEVSLTNNTKPRKAGTDLHVIFTNPISATEKVPATDERNPPVTTMGTVSQSDATNHTGTMADFTFTHDNVTNNSIPPGASVTVKFMGPKGTTIDKTKSYWTTPEEQPGSVAALGQPPGLLFNRDASGRFFGFAIFANAESVPVMYSNIQFFVNNDMANYNTNNFDRPTGQLVPGLPNQIILNPGQSSDLLPFGPVDPSRYVLGMAKAVAVGDEDDQYTVGTAEVPTTAAGTTPILLAGYNADVILDKDPATRFAQPFDANTFAWFESGAADDNGVQHDNGMAAGFMFRSQTGSGASYQIQPANVANTLQLGAGQTGTLTLMIPEPYTLLSVIASSGSGSPTSAGVGTINFADGSVQFFPYNTFDWCGDGGNPLPQAALPGQLGRANVGLSGTAFAYAQECAFQVYETVVPIDPFHAGVPILSIDFTGAPDAFYSNIFGVSGR